VVDLMSCTFWHVVSVFSDVFVGLDSVGHPSDF